METHDPGRRSWERDRHQIEACLMAGDGEEARRQLARVARRRARGERALDTPAAAEEVILRAEAGLLPPARVAEVAGLLRLLRTPRLYARLAPHWQQRVELLELEILERQGAWRGLLSRFCRCPPESGASGRARGGCAPAARMSLLAGRAARRLDRPELAEQLLRRAWQVGAEREDPRAQLAACTALGSLLLERGRHAGARAVLRAGLGAARAQGGLRESLPARRLLATLHRRQGLLAEAARALEEVARQAAVLGALGLALAARLDLASIRMRLGERRAARRAAIEVLGEARRGGRTGDLVRACAALAALHVRSGALGRARIALARARRVAASAPLEAGLRSLLDLRHAELHLAGGRLEAAEELARESLRLASGPESGAGPGPPAPGPQPPGGEECDPSLLRAEGQRLLGEILLTQRRYQAAVRELETARRSFARAGDATGRDLATLALGKAQVASASGEAARRVGVRHRRGACRRLALYGVPIESLDLLRRGPVEIHTRAHLPAGPPPPRPARLPPRGRAGSLGGPEHWEAFGIVTRSTRLHTELLHLARVAPSSLPILLHGETGCGKEVVAKAVHAMSHRAGRFVVFNAATCQEALLEAELFGHRRGAFTGAHRDRAGLIARAERGTLFLDEVAELRAPVQAAVLRFLDTGEVRAVGADEVGRGNARVVAASLRSLRHEVDRGRFRPDLYFRLAGAEVDLPPLRARPEDILPLARLFAGRRGVAAETLDDLLADGLGERLLAYPWPGNVRQLQHWVDQLAALLLAGASRRQIGQRLAHPLTILAGRAREGTAQQGARAGAMPGREELIRLLVLHRGNIARVAADLQTYRTRVYRWLRRRGIDYDTFRVTSPGSDRATSRRPDRQ